MGTDHGAGLSASDAGQRRTLIQVLLLNAGLSAALLTTGLAADSSGLIANALDNASDAAVYGISLFAVGRAPQWKSVAATVSGVLLLVFAAGVVVDVGRRFLVGAEPIGPTMVVMALVAVHGTEIFSAAQQKGVMVAFEAAVAGGIPIIKALREGLTANRIEWAAGIINGTTNFILSEMRDKGLSFDDVLKEAQRLGYAEADPTFDIEGVDAAHKATLIASIAYGIPVQFDKAYIEGITKLEASDIKYAEQLGYRIKLLGIAKRRDNGVELRVHPTLVPAKRLIANVEGAMNAVMVKGDAVGTTLYYGKGAGAEPTASAVVADLVDVARLADADAEHRVPHLAFQPDAMSNLPILPMSEIETGYYLRLRVEDKPGVLADITRILADQGISIDALLQREPEEGEGETDIIILTHVCKESAADAAIGKIEGLAAQKGKVKRIRLEELQ